MLVTESEKSQPLDQPSTKSNREQSYYWMAVEQLQEEPIEFVSNIIYSRSCLKCHIYKSHLQLSLEGLRTFLSQLLFIDVI